VSRSRPLSRNPRRGPHGSRCQVLRSRKVKILRGATTVEFLSSAPGFTTWPGRDPSFFQPACHFPPSWTRPSDHAVPSSVFFPARAWDTSPARRNPRPSSAHERQPVGDSEFTVQGQVHVPVAPSRRRLPAGRWPCLRGRRSRCSRPGPVFFMRSAPSDSAPPLTSADAASSARNLRGHGRAPWPPPTRSGLIDC
jgi:hypothetical protein